MSFNSPDFILYNGNFLSMNEAESKYRAIAIKDGKICAVFENEASAAEARRGFATELIDMEGKTIVPGFIDCNVHLVQNGISNYCINLHAPSKKEFLDKLAKHVKNYEGGQLIWGVGFETYGEPLNRWDLDKVSPNNPIVISRMEFHSTIVNTSAYNMLTMPPSIRGIEKDENDMPTGCLKGEASGFARRKTNSIFVNSSMRKKAVERTMREAIKCGITTLNAMEGGYFFCDADMALVRELSEKYEADILMFPQTFEVDEAEALGQNRIGGNIYVDGTIGSRTAAISHGYEGEPENLGLLYYTQEELNQFVIEAHKKGLQIGLSCIGERGIEQTLNAFELAFRLNGKGNHRHRLELFVMPTEEQIDRAVEMGLIFSMRPSYDLIWGGKEGLYKKNVGERYKITNPIGRIIAKGGIVAGGSECSVTPINPMTGIFAAVNHNIEDNRITVMEALKMYTVNGAYANFMENIVGKIEVGLNADLAVLSENPLEIPTSRLADIKVITTMKKGVILYG